jgi:DNA-binding transcriptional ArsR family regulator
MRERCEEMEIFPCVNFGAAVKVNHMVNYSAPSLDSVFGALADPTRRCILELLARAECRVAELACRFSISAPAISRHLRVLEKAGLIVRRRDGRVHRLRLEGRRMQDASAWIDQYRGFWEDQFSSLARYLEQNPEKKP